MSEPAETLHQLRQRAVRLLARREHTRAELATKLGAYGDVDDVSAVIDDLAARGLQSDARFAEAYVRSQAARLGAARLTHTLRRKGVADDVLRQTLDTADLDDELVRARALWQRKFGHAPVDARDWARHARFLQSRGFAADLIRRLLRAPEDAS